MDKLEITDLVGMANKFSDLHKRLTEIEAYLINDEINKAGVGLILINRSLYNLEEIIVQGAMAINATDFMLELALTLKGLEDKQDGTS